MMVEETGVEFIPVTTVADEEILDTILSQPFSYVSTEGAVWRSAAERMRRVKDERKSHLLVISCGNPVGAVGWSPGQTPGFFRLDLVSCRDEAWTADLVDRALRRAMALLTRAREVQRVELLTPAYNDVFLEYLTACAGFEVEGILRDRFFLDGRYWPGVVCCADLREFAPQGAAEPAGRQELLDRLHKKALEDLTEAHRAMWNA
ncbi:hypothetical protein J7E88_05585 [Streptomyces sp. ISL-10]|uniref:hypothetical protein n=1 Tax=Streptomyces sp. ISL-10 TaxID=2819172 RepID=UPI001BE54DBD|nr:hypothetical protein [Streptomyces sp. ISL-10]MBT2364804.1 hypothetical protein [Streptomyces sp. ISL-10]